MKRKAVHKAVSTCNEPELRVADPFRAFPPHPTLLNGRPVLTIKINILLFSDGVFRSVRDNACIWINRTCGRGHHHDITGK